MFIDLYCPPHIFAGQKRGANTNENEGEGEGEDAQLVGEASAVLVKSTDEAYLAEKKVRDALNERTPHTGHYFYTFDSDTPLSPAPHVLLSYPHTPAEYVSLAQYFEDRVCQAAPSLVEHEFREFYAHLERAVSLLPAPFPLQFAVRPTADELPVLLLKPFRALPVYPCLDAQFREIYRVLLEYRHTRVREIFGRLQKNYPFCK